MINKPLVSIVVPIYNVEKYLRQCVDSILSQTLKNIEVILVDDGSPDACPAIVDAYAAQDSRVIPIHQPNGGYGKAVNAGIAHATAPYIGIIESDDWIEPTMYEKLYCRASEAHADLVKCMFWKYDSTKKKHRQNKLWTDTLDLRTAPDSPFRPLEYTDIYMYHASLWSNLYRADFLRQVPMPETAGAAYQDFPFIMEIYTLAQRMCIVKEPLLHYRMEPGQSSSTMINGKGLMRMGTMTKEAKELLIRYDVMDRVKEEFYYHAFLANYGFYMRINQDYRQEYKDILMSIFSPIIKEDSNFTWKHFDEKQKDFVQMVAMPQTEQSLKQLRKEMDDFELMLHYNKLLLHYRIMCIKSIIYSGNKRMKYKEKKQQLKLLLRRCRQWRKESWKKIRYWY